MAKVPDLFGAIDSQVADSITLRLAVAGEGYGGYIKQMVRMWTASGMSEENILTKLEQELSPGGTLFDGMMNGFKNAAGIAVDYVSVEEIHRQWTGPDQWIWLTVTDENRCEDCAHRHGLVKPWADWEAEGLPGTGATVCGWRCRCVLEPKQYVQGIGLEDFLSG